jgi:ABC-type lipoprotein export system ATPase subunit/GNAT superfamily N-acetyltransferase
LETSLHEPFKTGADVVAETALYRAEPVACGCEYEVLRVGAKGDSKRVVIKSANGPLEILLHRFALVGSGDRIRVRQSLQQRVSVVSSDPDGREVPVSPPFEHESRVAFAGEETVVRVVEPTTRADHISHRELEAFHYRGLDLSEAGRGKKKGTGGRRAVLLLQLRLDGRWETAGYIELQMPLLMAKPRHVAFNRPFRHPSGVNWDGWRKGGQENVNRLVRIARTVVHPEFRGAKLSAVLVRAAMSFARERWHIGGHRPLFLEISAEMLRHIDFVAGCGFHFLGETEGNRGRVAKDLDSIRRGAKGESGIMSVQRKYFAAFEQYRMGTDETFESLQARIAELLSLPDPFGAMTKEEWLALRPVIRSPIPYYVIGLDAVADDYVRAAAVSRGEGTAPPKPVRLEGVQLHSVELWSNYEIPQTSANRLVMEGFGISAQRVVQRLIGPVGFSAPAGTVTFVAGASGCGKSLFLANLDPRWSSPTVDARGTTKPLEYRAGWLRPFPPGSTLFEHLADRHGAARAFGALARVGLSEALLFLKPFEMLSRGQRYRAMLADLLLRDDDVWLVDEFCSDLDPLSARIVASRLRETVREEGRTAFVAAANHNHFIHALRPSQVLLLRTGRDAVVGSWKDYVDGVLQ